MTPTPRITPLLFLVAVLAAAVTTKATDREPGETKFEFATKADAAGWIEWSPREEIAPRFFFDERGGSDGRGALAISAVRKSDFGAWRRAIDGVRGGAMYRFTARYRATQVEAERRSVITRLQWLDAAGKPVTATVRPPEYPLDAGQEGGWTRVESVLRAPDEAAGIEVQLSLGFAPGGTVRWDSIELVEVAGAPGRVVRVMTVHHRPRDSKSAEANVEAFCALVREAAAQRPDIVCLPEGMTVIGTGKTYADVAESIPGPSTARLGEVARELGAYIVAGIYERDGPAVYNTAVLIDRGGQVAGRYRKTHLPREEWERGLTPGDEYPVFETDFGKLGILVCWDLQFPEPWRAVALQGAELVLVPIWGGNEKLLPARAIENHMFIVTSGYNMRSCVVDPTGEILAEATAAAPVATAEVHLDRKIYQSWIGDMSTRTWKERRGDLPWTAESLRESANGEGL